MSQFLVQSQPSFAQPQLMQMMQQPQLMQHVMMPRQQSQPQFVVVTQQPQVPMQQMQLQQLQQMQMQQMQMQQMQMMQQPHGVVFVQVPQSFGDQSSQPESGDQSSSQGPTSSTSSLELPKQEEKKRAAHARGAYPPVVLRVCASTPEGRLAGSIAKRIRNTQTVVASLGQCPTRVMHAIRELRLAVSYLRADGYSMLAQFSLGAKAQGSVPELRARGGTDVEHPAIGDGEVRVTRTTRVVEAVGALRAVLARCNGTGLTVHCENNSAALNTAAKAFATCTPQVLVVPRAPSKYPFNDVDFEFSVYVGDLDSTESQ